MGVLRMSSSGGGGQLNIDVGGRDDASSAKSSSNCGCSYSGRVLSALSVSGLEVKRKRLQANGKGQCKRQFYIVFFAFECQKRIVFEGRNKFVFV